VNISPNKRVELAAATLPAAKLHVLGLAPLKEKLGPRWERLSALVHRLMEKAIRAAQGPSDHCIVLNELSYAITFGNLSLSEASRVCAAIAREVCEHLFGDQIDEVSVRSIVAEIATLGSLDGAALGSRIETLVEAHGLEAVITHSVESGAPAPVVVVAGNATRKSPLTADTIKTIQAHFATYGLKLGLLPIWNLKRASSNCVFVTPLSVDSVAVPSGKLITRGMTDAQILDLEIDQLVAAAYFAEQMRAAGKVCAVGVGVSYYSINSFRARIRYLTALQKLQFHSKNPLLLKLEQIPAGAPEGRVGELVSMLSSENVRITLELESIAAVAMLELRLGLVGVGGVIPPGLDKSAAALLCRKLVHYVGAHKMFAFLDRLDSEGQCVLAAREGVKFGMGMALTPRPLETIGQGLMFPMRLQGDLS
jgi:hypothetical protein